MQKPMQSVFAFFLIIFAAITVFAQTGKDGVVTINGGSRTLFLKPPVQVTGPEAPLPPGVVVIYSNLVKGDQAYNPNAGVGIVGKDAGQPLPQWVGIAFTPKADHLVQAIRVAATYVGGSNEIAMLLDADDHGIPGAPLHAWKLSGLPQFGSCCILQTRKYEAGIPVKAGTQYWVVLRTLPNARDTYGVWDDNFNGIEGTWANDTGQGWHTSYQTLPAVGVYGH
ncbi:MAG: hypothetical protein ACRD3L_15875 [Terriglobales bacterium]